jgi:Ran GTPase-activating protein (RanGAP) involved in mRNA processing and transport
VNSFGDTTGAVECIVELGSNTTLLKIDLTRCILGNGDDSVLAQTLSSRNATLEKLSLRFNSITSTGVGWLLETMEQNSCHIMDLHLQHNRIGNEGGSLIAATLGNNAFSNLTRLCLSYCDIEDDEPCVDGKAAILSFS